MAQLENFAVPPRITMAGRRADRLAQGAYSRELGRYFSLIEKFDPGLAAHCARVEQLSLLVGIRMGLSAQARSNLLAAARIHDLGKARMDGGVYFKVGPLTEAEEAAMRSHVLLGANEIKENLVFSDQVWKGILHHHEKWEGTGHPTGLCGEEIPLISRIIAVPDVFDALTRERPYRPEILSVPEAAARIKSGRHFDPQVVEAFLEVMEGFKIY